MNAFNINLVVQHFQASIVNVPLLFVAGPHTTPKIFVDYSSICRSKSGTVLLTKVVPAYESSPALALRAAEDWMKGKLDSKKVTSSAIIICVISTP